MPLTCNIDQRGKRKRFISGLVSLTIAIAVAALWAWPTGSKIAWAVVGILAFTGAFTLFEARAGWCALRALGIKTRV